MASKGRPDGSCPEYFFKIPEHLIEDFPVETLQFEPWVEDLLNDKKKDTSIQHVHKKHLWRTPDGKLIEMCKLGVVLHHKDWFLVE